MNPENMMIDGAEGLGELTEDQKQYLEAQAKHQEMGAEKTFYLVEGITDPYIAKAITDMVLVNTPIKLISTVMEIKVQYIYNLIGQNPEILRMKQEATERSALAIKDKWARQKKADEVQQGRMLEQVKLDAEARQKRRVEERKKSEE